MNKHEFSALEFHFEAYTPGSSNCQAQGFTLIELMIVVAIVTILSAIAWPTYMGFVARAQVSECLSLSATARIGIANHLAGRGVMPEDNEAIGLPAPEAILGKYVSSVTVADGSVACQFSSTDPFRAVAALNSRILIMAPVLPAPAGSSLGWRCESTTIPEALLPVLCRSGSN